ncbi:protein HYPER-SENSITIVITY-RELATED 4 [Sesamum alatum]|uniref:Protein HYPER-SENSITIVITY-RELATED 4 n=1 Tax=Sesamum alatum TaxID=300844 RepID=A0AAE2CX26_9LAMI|nr:protein HYPER-SENSITIVITY-RELATED 4 [Sesamum alatum]
MYSNIQLPSTNTVVSAAASLAATAVLVRSFAKDFLPHELSQYFFLKFQNLLTAFSNEVTLVIDEFDGLNKNQLFHAARLYVDTIVNPSTKRFRATLPEKEKAIHVSVGGNEEITDKFCGFKLKWRMVIKETQARYAPYPDEFHSTLKSEFRYLELTFHKKHKDKVFNEYLPYVLERSKAVKEEKKTLKLHTLRNDRMHGLRGNPWQAVNLDHPANFGTLAMDDEIKKTIVDDLDRFQKRKEFYRKVGKAWKRGYLLFGPPGTGKSSLIAAMANYLNFDVYDLELTDLRGNSDLRKLLISTANRSILVVEDIDASIDLSKRSTAAPKPSPPFFHQNQGPKITLSGLLNFMDGLWSSCGDERIIIFTTNHKEKLDPALLRPGRMDVHIHMSYCTPCGFKMLATNYLGITGHPLILEAEALIASIKVTPAEVGEQLLKSDDHELALRHLIKFLEHKKETERVRDENLEMTKREVPNVEKMAEGSKNLTTCKTSDGLQELIKIAKASPAVKREKIPSKDEAANALKILMEFLEAEIGTKNVEDSDPNLGPSVATLSESGKEEGIKTE